MARKITILGMGPTANERRLDIARYVDGTEVWGMNNGYNRFPGFTGWARWYEIHTLDYLHKWADCMNGLPTYCREIDALSVPVYRSEILPAIRNQAAFPELEMANHFGCNFWDGTPTRMFAHAIYEHDSGQTVEEIRSYGIDMQDTQHAPQLPVWCFWVAQALARGITLTGTALDRLSGPESDAGTAALRVAIGAKMNINKNKGGVTT